MFVEFSRLCVLSAEIHHRGLPRYLSEEVKIINISLPPVGIELTTCRFYSHKLVALRHDWPQL